MYFSLPTSLQVGGAEYKIRSDYRAALTVFAALADPELSPAEQGIVLLSVIYEDFAAMPPEHYPEALKEAMKFLNCGNGGEQKAKRPQLVDWEQDFQYIVAPINRVVGTEVRSLEYMHWWTFVSAYYEIGDCTFAQIVRIRSLRARGKKLDKADAEWYRQNRDIVDIKTRYSEKEEEFLAAWSGSPKPLNS